MRGSVFVDGGSRGNPGPSALGIVLYDEECHIIEMDNRFLGQHMSCNEAEYLALIAGLELATSNEISHLEVFSDSESVIRQMLGIYRVKSDDMKPLYAAALEAALGFQSVEYIHIPRERNRVADRLVNRALDAAAS